MNWFRKRSNIEFKDALQWVHDNFEPSVLCKEISKVSPFYTLEDLRAEMTKGPSSFKTGYYGIDEIWNIPNEAITIIAGGSEKRTAFLLNIYLNLIKEYSQYSFFFLSCESSRKPLLLNALNILSNTGQGDPVKREAIESYIRSSGGAQDHELKNTKTLKKIESVTQQVNQYVHEKRMGIIDAPIYIDELIAYLKYLKDTSQVGVVFIDSIQKVKIKNSSCGRHIELQRISEYLHEAAIRLSLPIVLGTEFAGEADNPESIDIGPLAEDANTVIAILNEPKASKNSDRTTSHRLDLSFLKNRGSRSGATLSLSFSSSSLIIRPLLWG